jgi:hypothetical protein
MDPPIWGKRVNEVGAATSLAHTRPSRTDDSDGYFRRLAVSMRNHPKLSNSADLIYYLRLNTVAESFSLVPGLE